MNGPIQFFQNQFIVDKKDRIFSLVDLTLSLISDKDNERLNMEPSKDIKKVVFALDENSACGPDSLTCHFYHVCWEIIEKYVVGVVKAFFQRRVLPKSITHTNLILIP